MSVYDSWPRWRQVTYNAIVRWLGTEPFVKRDGRRLLLLCAMCGHRIAWHRLPMRDWRFNACPSCDDYEDYMTNPERNPHHPDSMLECQ